MCSRTVLLSLMLVAVNSSVVVANCSIVGSDLRTLSHRFKERKGLFFNFRAPSQCSGTVTAWHFCYEMSACEAAAKYHATFLIYRANETNQTSGGLVAIPESIKSVSLTCQNGSRVKCNREILLSSEQFLIKEGDILAVCLPAEREHQLQLTSRKYQQDEEIGGIYQYNNEMIKDCKRRQIQYINRRDIWSRRHLQLHLNAEVESTNERVVADPNYIQRLKNDDKMHWYIKIVAASMGGLLVLIVFVAAVAGIALKCRQISVTSRQDSTGITSHAIAQCYPGIVHVPHSDTAMVAEYTLEDNVAYSVPIRAAQQAFQLQEENIYEIV